MKRQSRGNAFDISIRGDELEAHRIQLEHNLQNTELSFRLSTNSDDEEYDPRQQRSQQQQHSQHHYQHHQRQDSSIEYPRHISEPSIPDFPSFAHRSREHFGDEEHSHARGWSYRTGDDEEGISPYGGDTVSTAAHHASALTLSAGLMGGRAARRDPSLSGAEYDPDRPLHAMVAGVNSKHSMFDMTKNTEMAMSYDPLVVDSTAELDRILESGHTLPPTMQSQTSGRGNVNRPLSPISSASSSTSDSDARHPLSPASRPKLSDHLRHVSFSPKRPRNAGATANPSTSPLGRRRQQSEADPDASMYVNSNGPTPRPNRQPEVRLQPATPSSVSSKFTRMVRGINKELEGAQQQLHRQGNTTTNAASSTAVSARKVSAPVERNPFHDTPERNTSSGMRRASAMKDTNASMNTTRGKIHLPDVTGLTAAVESPAKAGTQYYKYAAEAKQRESEARLLQTLNAVQGQLHDLEEENGISRRRVRELEMELEECKREVARERTRLFENEEMSVRYHTQDRSIGGYRGGKANGKGKVRDAAPELNDAQLHARYKEAVEEKKSLESLINTLRTHLTRLTGELASHQELLTSLRQLREADAQELRAHSGEILNLREEVQRLAGEVEVLRGVVEEGLKERRASRDISRVEVAEEDRGMSRDLEEENEEEEEEDGDTEELEPTEESAHDLVEESDEEPEPFDPVSLLEEEQERIQRAAADRTMRTDHATLGESTNTNTRERFVDAEELDDIAAELEERRSNISNGSMRVRSPEPARRNMRATVDDTQDIEPRHLHQRQMPAANMNMHARAHTHPEPSTSRPSAPTPSHAARRPYHPKETEPETPFPQIRGEHLERLFFSAPEHNAKTCTVCFRRGDHGRSHIGSPLGWSKPRAPATTRRSEQERDDLQQHSDEGYEGSEGERPGSVVDKGKQVQAEALLYAGDTAQWRSTARKHGVPPQTVVARVIRELEDDFTHYKSIYVELADQYKVMDAASDVRRRNTLAKHLREVVDILEQKGDQIASLYDLLSFKDKPVLESVVPEKGAASAGPSWGGVAGKQR